MATSPNPVFAQGPIFSTSVVVTAANSTFSDTPNNVVEIPLAAALTNDGCLMVGLRAVNRGAVGTAGWVALYVSDDNGTTQRLVMTETFGTNTPSAAVAPRVVDFTYQGQVISVDYPYLIKAGTGGTAPRIYVAFSQALAAGMVFTAQFVPLQA